MRTRSPSGPNQRAPRSRRRKGPASLALLTLALIATSAQAAEPLVLDDTFQSGPIGLHLDVLEDPSGALTIAEVTSSEHSARFTPCLRVRNNYGYTRSAYWFRLRTSTPRGGLEEWLFDVGYEQLDSVTLYTREEPGGSYRAREAGVAHPFSARETRHRTVVFPVATRAGDQTLYLRVETTSPMNLPIVAWTGEAFDQHRTNEAVFLWLFYGLMAGMLLYNLFLFISVRIQSYLQYVMYLFAHMVFQLIHNGLATQYLWPNAQGDWNSRALLGFGFLTGLGMILFSRAFLDTHERIPRMDRLLRVLALVFITVSILALIGGFPLLSYIGTFCALLMTTTLMWSGLMVLRSGFRPARLYVLAWFTLLFGITVSLLKSLGVLPISFLTTWGHQIASAIEAVLLSLALAARIVDMRSSLAKLNAELEDKVNERTASLESASAHLAARSADLEATNIQLQATNHELLEEASERKRAQEEQAHLEEQLLQSQKLEAVGRLAGGVAHDINNTLGAIMAFASSAHEGLKPDDALRSDMVEILSACRRGRDLTANLLGFARKGSHLEIAVNLNDVVHEVSRLLHRTLSKKCDVTRTLEGDLEAIKGDPGQLSNALMNLCLNAVHAMGEEGQLTLVTRNILLDQNVSDRPDGLPGGPAVQLIVKDMGAGMDHETLSQVFEPFFTTKGPGEGTGLGLSMVYGVVTSHGGQVCIESELGKGTEVSLTFPAALSAPKTEVPSVPPVRAQRGSGRVLLVDDEAMIRRAGRRLLEGLGYEVVDAADGRQAVELFTREPGTYDLVIVDLMMPVMDGAETFDTLQALDPEVKVLLASGYSREGEPEELLERGAKGFLPKPFDVHALAEAVDLALGRAPNLT